MVTEKDGRHIDGTSIWSHMIGFVKLLWFLCINKRVLLIAVKTLRQEGSKTEYILQMRYKRMDPDLMDMILKSVVEHNDGEAAVVQQARDILKQ